MARSGESPLTGDAIRISRRDENEEVIGMADSNSGCSGSLDFPCEGIQETPDYIRRTSRRIRIAPVELFTEKNIDDFGENGYRGMVTDSCRVHNRNGCLEASLELGMGLGDEEGSSLLGINAGGIDETITCSSISFQRDEFFTGGETISTDALVGEGNGLALYQSARCGNFSYKISSLDPGRYLLDLHFAEIVFTNGPPKMRIFDVFIQEEKVVSGLDIYAQVGPNKPLILSDLRTLVTGNEGISVRFEGVVGRPILNAISIRSDPSAGSRFQSQAPEDFAPISFYNSEMPTLEETEMRENICRNCLKLKDDYQSLCKQQIEVKQELEDVKQASKLKNRECDEAWKTLQELRMELMRKSMHVGSLAFAVEGQVKEKSRWFLSLRDLSRKFNLLKLEHAKLSEEALQYRSCLSDIVNLTTTVQTALDGHANLERENKHLKFKFLEEAKERKELYNKVLELKGNIRVFCRCRPLNMQEIAEGASVAIEFESAKDGELSVKAAHGAHKKLFKFDSVFSPEEDQGRVFEKTSAFATSVLDGYNVCIFAYGQTGTGKTFTMEGTEEARGVNYRTLQELFRIIKERERLFQYELSVSVLEVYNEQIHDLLLSGSQPGMATKRLEVRQVAEGAHHVPGLVEAHVSNMNEVWEVLQTGSKARAVGSTNANEHSSRSHCIYCVMVKGENLMNGNCTRSKLWLIDLAGSERVAKTDVQGERLKEAQNINKSLSALGDVISALANKNPHIPYRNSKLTHLLQDSLGGDSKTLMFVQISPAESDVGETLCSLNFASRVRGIELGPAKKQVDISELFRYKQMVEKAKQDNKNKDGQIKKMEEAILSLETKNKAKDLTNKNLQDKVKELESQLLIERKLARQHVDTKIAEHHLQQQEQRRQQQQQEQQEHEQLDFPSLTSPVKPLSEIKINHYEEQAMGLKELGNATRPLTENSIKQMPMPVIDNNFQKYYPLLKDKENKPELAEEESLPIRAGRVSLCPTARRIPTVPAPRRNSLIPLPTMRAVAPPVLPANTPSNLSPPLPTMLRAFNIRDGAGDSEVRTQEPRSTKKFNSILRRSLQKKVIFRSPMQQNIRRNGATGGLEKVRVSIGSSGRKARRVAVSEGKKSNQVGQHKRQQKEKERGWNNGTAVRNIL